MVGALHERNKMATYEITAPDGKTYEVTAPEGATEAQVLEYAKANYSKTPAEEVKRGRPTMAADPRRLDQGDGGAAASMGYSALKGAVIDPALGTSQLMTNILASEGTKTPFAATANLLSKYLTGKTAKQATQEAINTEQAQYEASRQAAGRTGLDVPLLAGAIFSPVNKLTGGAGLIGTGALQGAMQPVVGGEDYLATKAIQTGAGAIIGPLLEGGVKLSAKALDQLKVVTESGKVQAVKDYLDKLIPADKKEAVIKALQSAQEIIPGSKPTAGQALVNTPEGRMLSSIEQGVAKTSIPMQERYAAQEVARQAELGKIAGTPAQRAATAEARTGLYGKYAEPALEANDAVRKAYTDIESSVLKNVPSLVKSAEELQAGQAANTAGIFYGAGTAPIQTVPSEVLPQEAAKKAAQLKKYQREALAETGVFPLEVNTLTSKLDALLKTTTSDESKKVLQGVKEDLLSKADNNGLIASSDLYENIRKVMNQNINRYLQQGEQAYQGGIPQQAAATGDKVKAIIDATLNKSSGGLWNKYLTEYTQHSQKLHRMAIGTSLQDKLGVPLLNKERAGSFAQAVSDSASLIKKATGQPRYRNLEEVLTPEEMSSVNKVMADLQRQENAITQGRSVNAPGFIEDMPGKDVNALNRYLTLAKGALHALSRGGKDQFNQKMAELMMEPNALALFMQSGPISGQRKLAEAINKRLSPETQSAWLQAVGVQPIAKQAGQGE